MRTTHRDDLHRGGFAGLRETRVVMNPRAWGAASLPGTRPGIGRFVYLADARFLPYGDTRMHPHREIDVISLMVEGRIRHEGSLEHGQELGPWDVQVQRAGGEGFSHNEVNPDATENRMIQCWVLPEVPGQPAGYRVHHVGSGQRLRVYGGPQGQDDTFPARTVLEVARFAPGQRLTHDGSCVAYLVAGSGFANERDVQEGHLVEAESFDFTAREEGALILASVS